MLKTILTQSSKSLKSLPSINILKRAFSSSETPIYPDQLIESIKTIDNSDKLKNYEGQIINMINWLDADQFTDVFIHYIKNDAGSYIFWDTLSRKMFDFKFDFVQLEHMKLASRNSTKPEEFIGNVFFKEMYGNTQHFVREQDYYKRMIAPEANLNKH